jgi:hypothetical protein
MYLMKLFNFGDFYQLYPIENDTDRNIQGMDSWTNVLMPIIKSRSFWRLYHPFTPAKALSWTH